jgi:excisionase family DNA binding protein
VTDNPEAQQTVNSVVCETCTVPEAGKILGLGRNSAYEAARNGELPTIRFGRRIVVPKAALKRLLES